MAARARRGGLSPFILLRRNALWKGLLGGQRGWLAVGAVVWAPRLVRKAFGKTEVVVATERLDPGQTLVLSAIPPSTRRERRAQRSAT